MFECTDYIGCAHSALRLGDAGRDARFLRGFEPAGALAPKRRRPFSLKTLNKMLKRARVLRFSEARY